MIDKRTGSRPHSALVTFSIPASIWAETVHLVGDFNDWNPLSHPLVATEENWRITLELEEGKLYHFHYLIDEENWCADPSVENYVANPRGECDSLLAI